MADETPRDDLVVAVGEANEKEKDSTTDYYGLEGLIKEINKLMKEELYLIQNGTDHESNFIKDQDIREEAESIVNLYIDEDKEEIVGLESLTSEEISNKIYETTTRLFAGGRVLEISALAEEILLDNYKLKE